MQCDVKIYCLIGISKDHLTGDVMLTCSASNEDYVVVGSIAGTLWSYERRTGMWRLMVFVALVILSCLCRPAYSLLDRPRGFSCSQGNSNLRVLIASVITQLSFCHHALNSLTSDPIH